MLDTFLFQKFCIIKVFYVSQHFHHFLRKSIHFDHLSMLTILRQFRCFRHFVPFFGHFFANFRMNIRYENADLEQSKRKLLKKSMKKKVKKYWNFLFQTREKYLSFFSEKIKPYIFIII